MLEMKIQHVWNAEGKFFDENKLEEEEIGNKDAQSTSPALLLLKCQCHFKIYVVT